MSNSNIPIKHQVDIGNWMDKQDGKIDVSELTTNKATVISESNVSELAVIDECQQKTSCRQIPTKTDNDDVIFHTSDPIEYKQKSGTVWSENFQQDVIRNVSTEKRRFHEKRPNYVDMVGRPVESCCSRDLEQTEGYRYKAVGKREVRRYRKYVIICIAILFIISLGCVAGMWVLQCEVDRLQELLKQQHLSSKGHTSMKDYRQNDQKDDAILQDDAMFLPGAFDFRPVTSSDVIQLSRGVRKADDPVKAGGKSKSKGKRKGNKKGKKKGKEKNLQVELFVRSWTDDHNPPTQEDNCGKHHKLPGSPITCYSQSYMYPRKGTVVGFFTKDENWHAVKKKRKHTNLLQLNSKGQFVVETPGTFLLHFNITLNDRTESKSLGVFLNGGVLFVCPAGGVRCSLTNEEDAKNFRLCTANGVAKLHLNDVVDIRTMDDNMTLKVKLQSQFWAVLLAKQMGP